MEAIERKPEWVDSAAHYPYDEALVRRFTFLSNFDEKYILYHLDGDEVWLPRGVCPMVNDKRDAGLPIECECNFTPRPGQPRMIERSYQLLLEDKSHILCAPTGTGKTVMCAVLIAKLKLRTLIITTKEDILDQWAESLISVLGSGIKVGIWRGDNVPAPDCDVVVGLVHSLMKGPGRYAKRHYQGFGLVVADEVHRMGADQFSKAMWWLPAKLRLGMSATPTRADGKDIVFRAHIGEVMSTMKQMTMVPKVLIQYTQWKPPKILQDGQVIDMPVKAGRTMHLSNLMAKDKQRNDIIGAFVHAAYEKGRHTVVFSDTIKHLEALHGVFKELGISPYRMGYYVGLAYYSGSHEERKGIRNSVKELPIMLATYKMFSEATDIPQLDTCVLSTPKADVIQIVGRILREHPDKKSPVVLDLVDYRVSLFEGYFKKRQKWYSSVGCEIKYLE